MWGNIGKLPKYWNGYENTRKMREEEEEEVASVWDSFLTPIVYSSYIAVWFSGALGVGGNS